MIYVFGFFLVLALVGFIINGVVLLVVNFWWLIIPALLLLAWWWYYRHPGVQAKRELRTAVTRGDEMRGDIKTATEQAKVEMDRITRDWRNN